jgi:hypothetical protein
MIPYIEFVLASGLAVDPTLFAPNTRADGDVDDQTMGSDEHHEGA